MSDDKTVFISYRRSTSKHLARAIFMDLRQNGYDAFLDVNTIDSGAFDSIILNQIAARMHFVILLSPGALERCQNQGDWLRREIEEALKLKRNIVPLIEEGFDFEKETSYLPSEWREQFKRLNGPRLFHDYFEAGMDGLRTRFLKPPQFSVEITPTPPAERAEVKQRVNEAADELTISVEAITAVRYVHSGNTKYDVKEYDEAIRDYDEAIRLNPHYAPAYVNRGNARHAKGDLDEAIRNYDEVIRLNPEDVAAYYNRGLVRYTKGDLDEAISDFGEAIRLEPQYIGAYYNRGNARHAKGDFDRAMDDFSEVIRFNPQFAAAYKNRGNVHIINADFESAINDFDEAIRINPEYADAYWGRGNCYYDMERYEEALRDYERYVEIAGANPSVFVVQRIKDIKSK